MTIEYRNPNDEIRDSGGGENWTGRCVAVRFSCGCAAEDLAGRSELDWLRDSPAKQIEKEEEEDEEEDWIEVKPVRPDLFLQVVGNQGRGQTQSNPVKPIYGKEL
jgi:hypothetical protein